MSQRPVALSVGSSPHALPRGPPGGEESSCVKKSQVVSGHRRARSSGRAILGPKQPVVGSCTPSSGAARIAARVSKGRALRRRAQRSWKRRRSRAKAEPEPGRQPPPPSARAEWARRPCAARRLPRPPRKPRRARGQGRRPALPSRSSFLGKRYLRSPQWPRAEHSRSRPQSRIRGATGAPSKR